jgi:hypothetical protein
MEMIPLRIFGEKDEKKSYFVIAYGRVLEEEGAVS